MNMYLRETLAEQRVRFYRERRQARGAALAFFLATCAASLALWWVG